MSNISVIATTSHCLTSDLPPSFSTYIEDFGFEFEDFDYEDPERFTKNIFTFSDGRVFEGYYGWMRYEEGVIYHNNEAVYRYKQQGIEHIKNDGVDDDTFLMINFAYERLSNYKNGAKVFKVGDSFKIEEIKN
jgi:hypothetical protein